MLQDIATRPHIKNITKNIQKSTIQTQSSKKNVFDSLQFGA